MRKKNFEKIKNGIELVLEGIGEDVRRPGLLETPDRVSDFLGELTAGYEIDVSSLLKPIPGEKSNDLVVLRGIEFSSTCEHHLAPFTGTCQIAYLPGASGIIGLSKFGRLVDAFSHRLQVQERLTAEIANALVEHGGALGALVRMEAVHTCMTTRGVKKTGSTTVTLAKRGVFENDDRAGEEALRLILQ